jgi:hypothetical protein
MLQRKHSLVLIMVVARQRAMLVIGACQVNHLIPAKYGRALLVIGARQVNHLVPADHVTVSDSREECFLELTSWFQGSTHHLLHYGFYKQAALVLSYCTLQRKNSLVPLMVVTMQHAFLVIRVRQVNHLVPAKYFTVGNFRETCFLRLTG